MSGRLIFATHAEVKIDPAVPVPDWGLTPQGRARHVAFARRLGSVASLWCSAERKAQEAAQAMAEITGAPITVVDALHENDRSATGYLPPDVFEDMADAFFANPETSVQGWERAVDAQARIVAAVARVGARAPEGLSVIVAHGGVGALYRAHLLGKPIDRSHDQPQGRGGGFALQVDDGRLSRDWTAIETW